MFNRYFREENYIEEKPYLEAWDIASELKRTSTILHTLIEDIESEFGGIRAIYHIESNYQCIENSIDALHSVYESLFEITRECEAIDNRPGGAE